MSDAACNETNIIFDYETSVVHFFTTRPGDFNKIVKRLLGETTYENNEDLTLRLLELGIKATINPGGKAYTLNNIPSKYVRSPVCAFKTTNKRKPRATKPEVEA